MPSKQKKGFWIRYLTFNFSNTFLMQKKQWLTFCLCFEDIYRNIQSTCGNLTGKKDRKITGFFFPTSRILAQKALSSGNKLFLLKVEQKKVLHVWKFKYWFFNGLNMVLDSEFTFWFTFYILPYLMLVRPDILFFFLFSSSILWVNKWYLYRVSITLYLILF